MVDLSHILLLVNEIHFFIERIGVLLRIRLRVNIIAVKKE